MIVSILRKNRETDLAQFCVQYRVNGKVVIETDASTGQLELGAGPCTIECSSCSFRYFLRGRIFYLARSNRLELSLKAGQGYSLIVNVEDVPSVHINPGLSILRGIKELLGGHIVSPQKYVSWPKTIELSIIER